MRMWKVDTKKMCRQHLLGEHLETHCFVGAILKKTSLRGYVENGLVELHYLETRHNELVEEMLHRGYKHQSPLPFFVSLHAGRVDSEKNLNVLKQRCVECRKLCTT